MPHRSGQVTGFYDKIAGAARLLAVLLLLDRSDYKSISEVLIQSSKGYFRKPVETAPQSFRGPDVQLSKWERQC